jgi:hypothetical protein
LEGCLDALEQLVSTMKAQPDRIKTKFRELASRATPVSRERREVDGVLQWDRFGCSNGQEGEQGEGHGG